MDYRCGCFFIYRSFFSFSSTPNSFDISLDKYFGDFQTTIFIFVTPIRFLGVDSSLTNRLRKDAPDKSICKRVRPRYYFLFIPVRYIKSTLISAGFTPLILDACPIFIGLILSSFSAASSLSPKIFL